MSCSFSTDVYATIEIARFVKERQPDLPVVVGGHHASLVPGDFLEPGWGAKLLQALEEFGEANGFPIHFSAEPALNVVQLPHILELLRDANFESLFIGIESPRTSSLLETKKKQNPAGPSSRTSARSSLTTW